MITMELNRRPLKSRSTAWAQAASRLMIRAGVAPDHISMLSVLFALLGAWALLCGPAPWGPLLAALCIQLRLLCNLLDGMVAIEGGRRSPYGALYNEIPDRLADSLFIVAAGYATGLDGLGWLGALAAAVTAYIRMLGGTLGLPQDFRGPMAKPHRMAVLTAACVVLAIERLWLGSDWSLQAALWVVAVGSLLTCVTRTRAIAAQLGTR